MAKRLKLKICRVIAITLQSCRSKDPSNLPTDPVPSFSHLSKFSHPRHVSSSAFISINCATKPPQLKWQKEEKWAEKSRRRAKKKRNIPSRKRLSTSSADSGWFSSEEGAEEESETLVSSSPGSSSELQRRSRRSRGAAEGESTAARLSMFKKLIPCTVEGKVKESFAIVKRSEDPYEDFKRSMMDMIVEKQMFEHKDLEQLLQCFLSLNSPNYHALIVQAFSEIWAAMFAPNAHYHRRSSF